MIKALKYLIVLILAVSALTVPAIATASDGTEEPHIYTKYKTYMPTEQKNKSISLSQTWTTGIINPDLGYIFNDEMHDFEAEVSKELYLCADPELANADSEAITLRVYIGIEDDVLGSYDMSALSSSRLVLEGSGFVRGTTKYYVDLADVGENDGYFLNLENKVGTLTADNFKIYADITLPRDQFPDIYGEIAKGEEDETFGNFWIYLELGFGDEILKSNALSYGYVRVGEKRILNMPTYSKSDIELCKRFELNHFRTAWYDYAGGLESAHESEDSEDSEGLQYFYKNSLSVKYVLRDNSVSEEEFNEYIEEFNRLYDISLKPNKGLRDNELKISFVVTEQYFEELKDQINIGSVKVTLENMDGEMLSEQEIDLFDDDNVFTVDELVSLNVLCNPSTKWVFLSEITDDMRKQFVTLSIPEDELVDDGAIRNYNMRILIEDSDGNSIMDFSYFHITYMRRGNKVVFLLQDAIPYLVDSREGVTLR